MKATAFAFILVLTAAPAGAQTGEDRRWDPWLGCWDLVTEADRSPVRPEDVADGEVRDLPVGGTKPRVCVSRTPEGGARFETTVRSKAAVDMPIVPDGTARPLSEGECRGTQRAEWSKNGLRLYTRANLTCGQDGSTRLVSGISMMMSASAWIDVQSVEVGSQETVRVRRYRRATGETAAARPATRVAPGFGLDDVKEATAHVSPRAIEAMLVETRAGFSLNSRILVDLDDAGVSDSVIDLLVALSYPERFVVERRRADFGQAAFADDPFLLGWTYRHPMWFSDFGYYDPFFGYYSPYYYSPFGYTYFGRYSGLYVGAGYYDGGFISSGGRGGDTSIQPTGTGRVVDGRGYTQVRPRDASASSGLAGGGPGSSTSSASSGGSVSSAGYSSGAASSSGGASSGGSSGGGGSGGGSSSSGSSSGGDGGRTAVPR